jgi:hypothetical protein
MIGKMKIIIFVVLLGLIMTMRIRKSTDDSEKNEAQEASRTAVSTEWIYLYDYSYAYTPVVSYSPVYYGAVRRSYYYYPYYSYYPRSHFWYWRKDGADATAPQASTPAPPAPAASTPAAKDAPAEPSRVENKDEKQEKDKKIQVKIEELVNNLKKLKKDLWKDENYDTVQLRKENKAYDPEWLLTQLNISTVLQIEDLLKENKIDLSKK